MIRENAHAGIGLSVMATGDFARNSFGNNGGRAIDVGLDGPTTATVAGYPGRGNGQELLGTFAPRSDELTFTVPRDLRGQSVRAAMVLRVLEDVDQSMIATSEMGEPRVVD